MNSESSTIGLERRVDERSVSVDRRHPDSSGWNTLWWPSRHEVIVQFLTRYIFWAIGSIFFLLVPGFKPVLLPLSGVLAVFGLYFVLNSVLFWMAMRDLTAGVLRAGMLGDMMLLTVGVMHDPYPVPPTALVFLMVILGNGMRYGMRPFAESAVVATFGMVICYGVRYQIGGFEPTPGDLFYGVFWLLLVVYAFLLMGQVDKHRRVLDYRSRFDPLTGLLNRSGFLDIAEPALVEASAEKPVALLFADLNAFKGINDRFGHAAGDLVLQEFGRILKESAQTNLVSRWGGDEFVMLLYLDDKAIHALMKRIAERARLWGQGHGLPMSASLGVAYAPADGTDIDLLLSVADMSMYKDKTERVAE